MVTVLLLMMMIVMIMMITVKRRRRRTATKTTTMMILTITMILMRTSVRVSELFQPALPILWSNNTDYVSVGRETRSQP